MMRLAHSKRVSGWALLGTVMMLMGCARAARPVTATVVPPAKKSARAKDPKYQWESPNGWKGGSFVLPPKGFAPDLGFHGREVLRFSPGYFVAGAVDNWTYAFVLLVNDVGDLSPTRLQKELHTYFVGLGRNLGKKKLAALSPERVVIKHLRSETAALRRRHTFEATVFDSWNTQAPIEVHLEVNVWRCEGQGYQAVFVSASPLPYTNDVWQSLRRELHAFRCRV